ncbi:O-antigen ligase family protein [Bifidobacterium avesanii]|nr:O-antigen ligase family protein [Bifidobacterium avesanii]
MIYHFSDRNMYTHFIEIIQIIGLTYMTVVVVRQERDLNQILDFLTITFSIYSIFGIIESVFKWNIFDTLSNTKVVYENANEIRFGLARARGACDISITNGMLLSMIVCLIAYRGINTKKRRYLIPFFIVLINCFLTLSRSIWIEVSLSLLLIFLSLSTYKQILNIIRIIFSAVILLFFANFAMPQVIQNLGKVFYSMFDSIISVISGTNSSDMQGAGDRFRLWNWVWISVKDSATWGKGYTANFSYPAPEGYIKKSIEVMWLYELFHIGLVGLASYIFLQISSLLYLLKNFFLKKRNEIFSFNLLLLIISIAYIIAQFSCFASEDLRFYYFLLGLGFAYNNLPNNFTKA